jgi:N-carbamoyl-L-amino-acid hydrolase
MDAVIREGLRSSADALEIPVMDLGSPASHDAAAFAAAGVPSGMIFIRNENGSHNPREAMTMADFMAGATVMTGWLAQSIGGS